MNKKIQPMTIQTYIDNLNTLFRTGNAREHSYRGDLQTLITNLTTDILVTNEPARIACGAPDYVLTRDNIPVGYIEAKDIGVDLKSKKLKEQFDRYRKSLPNLIFTDYMDFHFYTNGDFITNVAIAEVRNGKIVAIEKNFSHFTALMNDFVTTVSQSIKSSERLSKMMANKAKLLANIIGNALESDVENRQNTTLQQQLQAFEEILIHDITPREFADIYAQTIAYGMFAARLHDDTLDTFSRHEAAQLIPQSNPFLRKMFQYIAGYDLDSRITWIVDALADVFRATDVAALLKDFGKSTQTTDPIIHFYENFLAEYDPKLRKARGVWYTPEPVVNFIVRAVDDVLKTEFGLTKGLADTSKTKIKVKVATNDKRAKSGYTEYEKEIHKVQILDPATGTGTFLAEVVKFIYNKNFKRMQGAWSGYVENDLIPRLNGFELLMASYAMAHLKLDLLLQETGYKAKLTTDADAQRFKIFLTNSLEPGISEVPNLFMAQWLTDESIQASQVKEDTPVMVILGNPPYSGESANKGEWIMDLMDDYKKEPGGKEKLKERNPKWINDDYVKFMRYGQHFIEKNGEGILAFINPHGFLDNPTFRGMRWHLLKTYDKIYTIDLHGNSKKKETAPDGSVDQNVFDIQQGVSINILIKTGKKKANELGQVFHYDLYGKRDLKYDFLIQNSLKSIDFQPLPNKAPMYFMVQKDFAAEDIYNKGFSLTKLFIINGVGITTAHDDFVIKDSYNELLAMYQDFQKSERNSDFLHRKFNVKKKKGWNILEGYDNIKNEQDLKKYIYPIAYRPFDNKYIFYEDKLVWRTVRSVMKHLQFDNLAISSTRSRRNDASCYFYTRFITDKSIASSLDNNYIFPLYLYEETENVLFSESKRKPNFDPKIMDKIAEGLGLRFTAEKVETLHCNVSTSATFVPIDILDYIYAVLHSPTYRETYKEFLKIDFPRVPFPEKATFWALVKLGGELRQLHLLAFETSDIEESDAFKASGSLATYPEDGDNIVTRKMTSKNIGYAATSDTHGNVWINDTQYFENVPLVAWEFYIGGYQPAQKWLKDRKERELSYEDIQHYGKIIVALTETDRIMKAIDGVSIE
jgi:predicted helicase